MRGDYSPRIFCLCLSYGTVIAKSIRTLVELMRREAEITVDDKFLGTTPSTVQLTPGEHKIVVLKAGFRSWERTMTINPNGNVNLDVTLEKIP